MQPYIINACTLPLAVDLLATELDFCVLGAGFSLWEMLVDVRRESRGFSVLLSRPSRRKSSSESEYGGPTQNEQVCLLFNVYPSAFTN